MVIKIDAQVTNAMRGFERQMPFAIALAITRTAQDAQQEVKGQLPSRFALRNGWTARNIRIQAASKSGLEATITAPDYMAKQETGETEHAKRRYLVAPAPAIGNRIAPAGMRPSAVLRQPRTFIIEAGGSVAIAQRKGRKAKPLRILWWLTPTQRNTERFEFGDTSAKVVERRFAIRFQEAFARAVATAR